MNLSELNAADNSLSSLPVGLGSIDLDDVDLRNNQLRGDISVLAGGLADGDLQVLIGDGAGGNDCLTTTNPDSRRNPIRFGRVHV